jgi:hypothetical protein
MTEGEGGRFMKRVDTIALSHVAMLLRLETSHQHTQSGLEQGC